MANTAITIVSTSFSGMGVAIIAAGWHFGRRVLNAVNRVEAQTQNNGGTSLRDAVDRIELRLDRVEKRQKRIRKQMIRQ